MHVADACQDPTLHIDCDQKEMFVLILQDCALHAGRGVGAMLFVETFPS